MKNSKELATEGRALPCGLCLSSSESCRPAGSTFPKPPALLWPVLTEEASLLGVALSFPPHAVHCRIIGCAGNSLDSSPETSPTESSSVSRRMHPGSRGSPWANGKSPYSTPSELKVRTVTLASEGCSYLQVGPGKEEPKISLQFSGARLALYTKVIFFNLGMNTF